MGPGGSVHLCKLPGLTHVNEQEESKRTADSRQKSEDR
jgi:hypothetical protein